MSYAFFVSRLSRLCPAIFMSHFLCFLCRTLNFCNALACLYRMIFMQLRCIIDVTFVQKLPPVSDQLPVFLQAVQRPGKLCEEAGQPEPDVSHGFGQSHAGE